MKRLSLQEQILIASLRVPEDVMIFTDQPNPEVANEE
jgi:hypothetical protein